MALVVVHNYRHKVDGRLSSLRGGYIGVTLFFVLSGFLITSLLLVEHDTTGKVRIGSFYLRRAFRLLPALMLTLAFLLVLGAWTGEQWRPQLIHTGSVVGYFFNWWHGAGPIPEGWGPLWSLSVEEQFYMVWPLLLVAMLALVGRRAQGRRRDDIIATIAAVTAIALALWRTVAWANGSSEVPLYVQTHFRADALLIGAVMALVLHRRPEVLQSARRFGYLFLPATGVFVAAAVFGSRADPADRPGWMLGPGMTFVALVAALMTLLAITAPAESLGRRVLDLRPVVWLGTRSYAVYLLHGPMAAAVSHAVGHGGATVAAISLVLTLVTAELSFRLLEQPVLRRLPAWAKRTTPALEPVVADQPV